MWHGRSWHSDVQHIDDGVLSNDIDVSAPKKTKNIKKNTDSDTRGATSPQWRKVRARFHAVPIREHRLR